MNRIQLQNTVFEGENSIYVLGTERGAPTTLIDTGVATAETRADIVDGLGEFGLTLADVDQILLTHWHHDHAALAGAIQEASDATVFVHEADAPLVEQDADALARLEDRQRTLFEQWGMPADKREELLAFLDRQDLVHGSPATVETFTDGDRFRVGDVELGVIHAPGHTAGLAAFAFAGEDGPEVFTGDALLPRYTPNIGGADVRVENPLESYVGTLERLANESFVRAWPGHRNAIHDPTARAVEIVDHHRERTQRVVDAVREHGPATAWDVSAELFGSLENIHIMHGPGEAYAHLNHLARTGVLSESDGTYEIEDATDEAIESAFPSFEVTE